MAKHFHHNTDPLDKNIQVPGVGKQQIKSNSFQVNLYVQTNGRQGWLGQCRPLVTCKNVEWLVSMGGQEEKGTTEDEMAGWHH